MPERRFTSGELRDWLRKINQYPTKKAAQAWTELYTCLGPDPEDIGRSANRDTVALRQQWKQLEKELEAGEPETDDPLSDLREYVNSKNQQG